MKDKKILISGSDIELANGDYNLITKKGIPMMVVLFLLHVIKI